MEKQEAGEEQADRQSGGAQSTGGQVQGMTGGAAGGAGDVEDTEGLDDNTESTENGDTGKH